MKEYTVEQRMKDFLMLVAEPEYSYRKVLVVDKKDLNHIRNEGDEYPQIYNVGKSLRPVCESDLVFFEMPNGGLKCIKDRYDFYKRDTIWFGL